MVSMPEYLPTERLAQDGICSFLFQGGFSLGRGIDLLISYWPYVVDTAHLYLRGPASPYKEQMISLAAATGLLGRRIFFPEPVEEQALIEEAAKADVGIIPYSPIGANHIYCCPNKASQYMAAGIPILANDTSYVRHILEQSGGGLVVDFKSRERFVAVVASLTEDPSLRKRLRQAGRAYFESTFHWEALAPDFYQALIDATQWADAALLVQYSKSRSESYLVLSEVAREATVEDSKQVSRVRDSALSWYFIAYSMVGRLLPRPVKRILRPFLRWLRG